MTTQNWHLEHPHTTAFADCEDPAAIVVEFTERKELTSVDLTDRRAVHARLPMEQALRLCEALSRSIANAIRTVPCRAEREPLPPSHVIAAGERGVSFVSAVIALGVAVVLAVSTFLLIRDDDTGNERATGTDAATACLNLYDALVGVAVTEPTPDAELTRRYGTLRDAMRSVRSVNARTWHDPVIDSARPFVVLYGVKVPRPDLTLAVLDKCVTAGLITETGKEPWNPTAPLPFGDGATVEIGTPLRVWTDETGALCSDDGTTITCGG